MYKSILFISALFATSSALLAQSSIDTYDVCDANLNHEVSVADATTVVNQVLANTPGSEVVTAKDLNAVLQLIDSRLAALEAANGISHPTTPGANASVTYFEFALKSMQVGQTFTQTVHTESTGAVSYFSTNTTVATVNATTGEVTANANGETMIVATISASGEYPAASAAYTVTVEAANMHNGHEYVDLGLPSGLLWATCNVGANSPEEYGDYFAWGETEGYNSGKTNFSWSTYKWMQEGYSDWQHITKYTIDDGQKSGIWYDSNGNFIGDNKTVLEPADDAAHVNWGGSWRMPTYEELDELTTKCTWEWTTQNGVKGRKVTGPNGNSIFLPAAGYRLYSSLYRAGSYGYYWSSSLYASYSDVAYDLDIKSDDVDWGYNIRDYGQSVRPVR